MSLRSSLLLIKAGLHPELAPEDPVSLLRSGTQQSDLPQAVRRHLDHLHILQGCGLNDIYRARAILLGPIRACEADALMRIALAPQTLLRRGVLFEAACRGHSNFQAARPRSSPITHSLGCSSTRLTKAVPSKIRL